MPIFDLLHCPMVGRAITLQKCQACALHARMVGCMELGRSVPEVYCTRECPHQCAKRGEPDGTETADKDRRPPLASAAMCGAPKVRAKFGGPRPVFEAVDGVPPFEDPKANVTPACTYPREIKKMRAEIEV